MKNISGIIDELQREHDELKKEYDVISKRAENMKSKLNSLNGAIINLKNAYSANVSYGLTGVVDNSSSTTMLKRTRFSEKRNFVTLITEILNRYGHPLTSRQLQDEYNDMVNDDEKKDRNTFSGMISHTYSNKNQIARTELSEIKGRSKFVYGLPSWFNDEGNLKQEYLNKLKNNTNLFANKKPD